ncbi:hypothetical protein PTRG_08138 [Pyrenophora tritici-repentis Pt-1C-BFP]|uniref:Uncharacterized protein n=1 Tax=Pyrenophora tritici-repentis (strain Pt-1C-BFP) TaxID=426418 RepID=B2WEX7_PYRTR|nr:uncharacterized protein PTRG_08138 [Pyrenophora tritici-repentis Pt-1C-BFP]EDU51057.1 hypothetical protein PTRG_08138 [Pyrenophora tritici-repentis Pt-1C-BFP]
MRLPSTALVLVAPLLALAKDCAVYYDHLLPENTKENSNTNADRDWNIIQWCVDNHGTNGKTDTGVVNGQKPNVCTICRALDDNIGDTVLDIQDKRSGVWVHYTVACGDFPTGSCHSS